MVLSYMIASLFLLLREQESLHRPCLPTNLPFPVNLTLALARIITRTLDLVLALAFARILSVTLTRIWAKLLAIVSMAKLGKWKRPRLRHATKAKQTPTKHRPVKRIDWSIKVVEGNQGFQLTLATRKASPKRDCAKKIQSNAIIPVVMW